MPCNNQEKGGVFYGPWASPTNEKVRGEFKKGKTKGDRNGAARISKKGKRRTGSCDILRQRGQKKAYSGESSYLNQRKR